jgi:hypothetical protein
MAEESFAVGSVVDGDVKFGMVTDDVTAMDLVNGFSVSWE